MKASDLLPLACDWLQRQYPDALVVPELSVGNWGSALLDVAAIVPPVKGGVSGRSDTGHIVGIEIKGEGDSPSRLALQGAAYSKAAQRMYLLCSPANQSKIQRHRPRSWGALGVVDGRVERIVAAGFVDPRPRAPTWLCTAPAQLLQALWKEELLSLGNCLGFQPSRRQTVDDLIELISERATLSEIRAGVVTALLERNWQHKNVRRAA